MAAMGITGGLALSARGAAVDGTWIQPLNDNYSMSTAQYWQHAAVDMLANVGAITVDYADTPTRGRIPVCPLYGLTEEAVQAKVTVTVAGAPVDNIQVKVENGTITLRNTSGTLLFFR